MYYTIAISNIFFEEPAVLDPRLRGKGSGTSPACRFFRRRLTAQGEDHHEIRHRQERKRADLRNPQHRRGGEPSQGLR
ncbi:MAG TPA: hypothetical protein PLK84_04295, partial [Syntrophales bacterium]|nr:hypothetical protein [Syntrophales bacterium]